MRTLNRPSRTLLYLAAGLLATTCSVVVASEPPLTGVNIEASSAPSERGETITLHIEDTWPSACVPTLQRVEVRGRDIAVYAREPTDAARCLAQPNRYRIDASAILDPAGLLPTPGIQRVRYVVESPLGSQLRGFELLQLDTTSAATQLESGLWWPDPSRPSLYAGPGIGLTLERQGERLGLQLFGYDEDGRPEWTMASGNMQSGLARLPLTRFAGGAGPQAAYRAPSEGVLIGRLLLEPMTPSRAVLWLAYDEVGGSIGLREIPIARFALGGSAAAHWAGRWLLALPDAGDGFGRNLELMFGPAFTSPRGFLMLDETSGAELECEFPGREWAEMPAFCRLRLPEAGVDVMIDRPALQSLQGLDAAGREVRLFRLQP